MDGHLPRSACTAAAPPPHRRWCRHRASVAPALLQRRQRRQPAWQHLRLPRRRLAGCGELYARVLCGSEAVRREVHPTVGPLEQSSTCKLKFCGAGDTSRCDTMQSRFRGGGGGGGGGRREGSKTFSSWQADGQGTPLVISRGLRLLQRRTKYQMSMIVERETMCISTRSATIWNGLRSGQCIKILKQELEADQFSESGKF